ncbi:MAG: hypothetical protein V7641_111 [Blastocatellia bacterium]
MKFIVGGDNRNGSISVRSGKSDPRDDNYNITSENRYRKINRVLSERAGSGSGAISARLETSSEYINYANHECTGLAFTSKGTVELPQDQAATGHAIVQESIWMNIRIEQTGKVQLVASVLSDLDIAEISLQGPSFAKPVRIYDETDQTLDITKPGEYSLRGGYQLSVKVPASGLGGRPITVEINAKLTPVS